MIKKIQISDKDKQSVLTHDCPVDSSLKEVSFRDVVVNKPWGYEYLMFENNNIAIWFLYIKPGHSTSMHCHPKKKTSLLLITGEARCSTLNESSELKAKDGLILDKGVFHKTEAISDEGIFVMEIETPVDKTDLFRLKDNYRREMKSYTDKKNISNELYNYHYLFLNDKQNSTNVFGKYKFLVRSFSNSNNFLENIKETGSKVGVLISGKIESSGGDMEFGDMFNISDLKDCEINSPIKVLLIYERKNLVRVSDYIISFLIERGIQDVSLVSGGNLIYLLESLRVNGGMNYICNHHEQASTMVAEGYSKMKNDISFAMVTSGPGATNAITGVAGAWIDSNPMLIISGQSHESQTIKKTKLRQLGVQEINIIDMVRPITKYAVTIRDPKKIKYHLEKALYLAKSGRPGPVWLDIPINIQGAIVEKDELDSFKIIEKVSEVDNDLENQINESIKLIKKSERPIILLGNGVRLSGAEKEFLELAELLSIPIVTSRNANDLIWEEHPLYIGRVGSFGERGANLAIQNSDFVLSLGSRIALAVTGWAYKDFARNAKKIIVDIDEEELNKPIINPDLAIKSDVKNFISIMQSQLRDYISPNFESWKAKIKHWKDKYPIVLQNYKNCKDGVNTYYFTDLLSGELNEDDVVLTDMGMSFQTVMQAFKIKKGQRLFTSAGLAAMGFGLPGAIGACMANGNKKTICITGDGGLMMNIQELQTIFHNKLPIKIFVFNNKGYTSIRETQKHYFKGYIASEPSSGVSIPNLIKVAESYGIKAKKIKNQENLREDIQEVLNYPGPILCDIDVSENHLVMPKQGAFNRPDGKTVPRPIEDMAPFLDREEFNSEMIIDPVLFDPYKE
ncbi:thiamine pyrophosphate-binding protein [archaeon]|nr:thiamine pyrophosphate-binding protein [archaeon]